MEQNSGRQDPLALDRETMRRLGYLTVDALVERLGDPEIPPIRRASPQEMARRLNAGLPDGPESFEALLARLDEDVLPFMSWTSHPGFFAFIPSCGTWPAALGDLIASACNIYAAAWMESAGPSQVELQVLRWFADWVGYPESSAGALVSGGSAANMTALACAREALAGSMNDRLVAYVSDQAHSSLARAARLLGFRPDQVRVLPSDASFRLAPERVAAAMDADVRAGRTPLVVAATAGSTNTGAVESAARARRALPRARRLAPRRCRVRRIRRPHRAGPERAPRARAGGLADARPAQVALPAVRVRLPARARGRSAAPRVLDHAGLPAR